MRNPAAALVVLCLLATPVAARQDEPAASPAPEARPLTAVLAGRVLLKDGVTPFAGARLVLTDTVGKTPFEGKSARNGRYKLRLPVGSYTLQIIRDKDIYVSPAAYRVSAGVRNEIDFLIIPYFEKTPGSIETGEAAKHGPDPAPAGPSEVGTIVDVIHEHAESRWRRLGETLSFIGSLLLVALAAG